MYTEKRSRARVNLHLPVEMTIIHPAHRLSNYFQELATELGTPLGDPKDLYGYIYSLSEGGIGVFSLDWILPGMQVNAKINLPEAEEITPSASLVNDRIEGNLHYYGFKFNDLREKERSVIRKFVRNTDNTPG